MSKLKAVIGSPINTFSGYGVMARAFAKALIKAKKDEWDIKFLSLRWGNTPFGALDPSNEYDKFILDNILSENRITYQPDIWIQISVSNEFNPIGKYNIGYTCLVETSIVPGEMVEGLNRMDINLVSSEFTKRIGQTSIWDKRDNSGNVVGTIKSEKLLIPLFIGLDTDKFKKPQSISFDLSQVKESFCFLSVGHFLPGTDILEDRKMIGRTIKAFYEMFKDKKDKPALILKSSMGTYSYMDEEATLKAITNIKDTVISKDLPNVYLIHGELTEDELCELYAHEKVKAFVLPGNEGFGLPYIEFSAVSSKPIICSPMTGHVDFLKDDFNVYVNGKIEQIHPAASNQFLLKESSMFKADIKDLGNKMEDMYRNYAKYVDNGKRQGYKSRTEFNIDKMSEKLKQILDQNVPKMSVNVPLNLPQVKKLDLPKFKKD